MKILMVKAVFLLCFFVLFAVQAKAKAKKSKSAKKSKNQCDESTPGGAIACPDIISQALNNLTANYDNRVRPGFDKKEATVVLSYFLVTGIGPASEQDMEYTLDIIFRQKWQDSRLAYKDRVDSSIQELRLNSKMVESVWTPDTFFRNGKKSIAHKITVPNRLLRIYPTGDILYTMRLTIKAKCPMKLIDFPMDVHTCYLEFGSYAYTEDQIVYDWFSDASTDPVTLDANSSRLNQFKLIHYNWTKGVIKTISGDFAVLQTSFHLKRQMGYYVIQTYLPCILIVILSQISFWINKESVPARTVSGIMTVLNLTTLSISTRQSLPKVAYATALDWYMAISFAFCFAALIEFASVNHHQVKIKEASLKQKKTEKSRLEVCLIQSCVVLQDKFIEFKIGGKSRMVNLIDLLEIASGFPLEGAKGFPYWVNRIWGFMCLGSKLNNDGGDKGFTKAEKHLASTILREAEKEINDVATSPGGVSRIDQIARRAFPLAFLFFNGMYWFIYLSHQQHEVANRFEE